MPSVLIHNSLFVRYRVWTGTAAPTDVAGCHNGCAVVTAKEVEGNEDTEQSHEERLCYEDDTHLACNRGKLCEVCCHKNKCKVKLQEHMLDGVNLRNIELDVCSFHDVSCDGTCEEAADEFRHLNHRDIVE